jgi:uncharacterized membrane protein YhfC
MTITGLILRLLNASLMLGIPCFLALKLYRRGKGSFRPIWIGAAAFILSQVGHIPFNQFVMLPLLESNGISSLSQEGTPLLILGIAAGLSAGVFEETTRYLVMKFWLKRDHNDFLPVKYGVGHGGVEAVLTGLLVLYAFVQVMALGGDGALSAFDPEQVALIQSQLEAYWAVPWQYSLLGAWERVSAMSFHVGASIMVYKSIREKKPGWLLIALLGHTVFNAFVVILAPKMDLILLEGILFLFAAGWLVWAWLIRVREPDLLDPVQAPLPEVRFKAPQITSDQIEESRYDE